MLKDREISQRTFGFISFSFLTHVGLIAAAFLAPNMIKDMSPSSKQSETYLVDSTSKASLGEAAQAEPQVVAAKPEPKAEPVTEPVAQQEVAAPLPVKAVAKKVRATAKEKAEAATKKVLALPTKKAVATKAAHKVQTVDQSELAVNQDAKPEETKPEVAADVEAPEVKSETKADAKQESEQAPVAAVAAEAPADKEAVESATTSAPEEEKSEAAPVSAVKNEPLIAPIQKGAQTSHAPQIGGLSNTNPAPQAQAQQPSAAVNTGAAVAGGGGASSGGIRDADSLMEQAGNAKPVYSEDDQRNARQGTVVFDAMVNRDGTVQGIQLKQSSGHSSLDSSAYEAFKKHRYLPGQEGMVRKKFQFVLNGEKTLPTRLRRR